MHLESHVLMTEPAMCGYLGALIGPVGTGTSGLHTC